MVAMLYYLRESNEVLIVMWCVWYIWSYGGYIVPFVVYLFSNEDNHTSISTPSYFNLAGRPWLAATSLVTRWKRPVRALTRLGYAFRAPLH